MNIRAFSLFAIIFFSLLSCSENIDYQSAEKYIKKSAADWAEAIAIGDTATISRIMADDFVGISSRGQFYDKKRMLELSLESPNQFKTEVFDINVRLFDKAAVAQGFETWTKIADSTSTKSVWTDTWIYRDKKWQIVSAQDHRFTN